MHTAPNTKAIPSHPKALGHSLNKVNPQIVLNTVSMDARIEALEDSINVRPLEYNRYGRKPDSNPSPRYKSQAVSVCTKASVIASQSDIKLQPMALNKKV